MLDCPEEQERLEPEARPRPARWDSILPHGGSSSSYTRTPSRLMMGVYERGTGLLHGEEGIHDRELSILIKSNEHVGEEKKKKK